ncbi:MAG: pilus assembly protein [Gammaproteobacteria bacterium]|nr:pilus assembly protein [Gammaproteobacteria bacterium]
MRPDHSPSEFTSLRHRVAGSLYAGARQHGSVLIIGLLLLLVLTLLGLSSMGTTILQEKMANNMRDQNLAFQAAEAALQNGEQYVAGNAPVGFNSTCNGGLCLPSTTGTPVWNTVNWSTPNVITTSPPLSYLAAQPVYIIEQLPPVPAPGVNQSQQQYSNTPPLQFYRITARATGGNVAAGGAGGVSITMLQSVYQP